jgi:hypothetical protein
MPGLVPSIHDLSRLTRWMAGPSPAEADREGHATFGFGPRRRDKPGHDGLMLCLRNGFPYAL